MSQENVDKARNFIDAYNARDFDRATEDFDRDIDWVLPEHQASDSARGIPGVIRFFKGIDETFDELELLPQEYIDAGDLVATRLRHHGRGKGSGIEIDTELYHQVATFRDGVIVRMEYVTSWPEALELLAQAVDRAQSQSQAGRAPSERAQG
jgi:ketosteroid isomerase-like protein